MRFSIIVPIYRVEKYIHKCVSALIEQTYSDIEIILVDDGSPDGCPMICDEYAKQDNRIIVVHKQNHGLSEARNTGLKIASGDYVIFVDADDYIDLDTCEKLLEYAATGSDILIGDATVECGSIELSHIQPMLKIYSGIEYLNEAFNANKAPMAVWLNIYKRSFLIENELQFKHGILHEDEQFTPRVFLCARSVIVTGVNFYHYCIRENSITTKKDKRKNAVDLYSTCCELEKIYESIEDNELRERMLDSLSQKCLGMFQVGKLYQYGKQYIYKDFIRKNAFFNRTKCKAYLYCISPRLYYYLNKMHRKLSVRVDRL